ncbi:hypothetical protein QBC39DRAFT_63648 [Podospora conica]|nr:hypothetical protein QBC39DRAFT_63648 [Schizothecium conicum]
MLLPSKSPFGMVTSLFIALFYAALAQGAPYSICPKEDVCISVAYPATTISQGSGNIYVQIWASTSYQWVAFGTGSSMSGSNMFVAYQDGSGNMTLSPRRGSGHFTPSLDTSSTAAQLQLLEGSGVSSDGKMVANFVCPNCVTWNGGSLSLSGADNWIGAWKSGSSLATTSESASINQHDSTVQFQVDSTQATVSSDTNPFLAETDGGISAPGGGDDGDGGGSGNGGGGGPGNGNNGLVQDGGGKGGLLLAHGAIMMVAFAALFPAGAMIMPLFRSWAFHGAFQTGIYLLTLAGLAVGINVAQRSGKLFNNGHTILGVVVIGALALQPIFGMMHHRYYMRERSRGVISHVHIWFGRVLLALGVINGGIGISMTGNRNGLAIPYAVLAAVSFTAWVIVKVVRHFRADKSW